MAGNTDFSSPKRVTKIRFDFENIPCSPPIKDIRMLPWNWGEGARLIQLSPASVSSPDVDDDDSGSRRGRPRADCINSLMKEGTVSPNGIKCNICNRVFPREKSLQAHLRTHTGERPYKCDYPGCGRAFCQSGQLKTHQRLHTGEKPFVCSSPGCTTRFAHANRHCPQHPFVALRRDLNPPLSPNIQKKDENNQQIANWIEAKRNSPELESTPRGKTGPLRQRQLKRQLDQEAQIENRSPKKVTKLISKKTINKDTSSERDTLLGAIALIELAQSGLNK